MKIRKFKALLTALLTTGLFFTTSPASAHQSPAACTNNDFVVNIGKSHTIAYDETSPFGATVITYTVDTGNPNTSGTGCDVGSVDVNLTTPDGVVHNLQTGGAYPIGTPVAFLGSVNYTADSADKTGNTLVASVSADGDLHDIPGAEDPFNIGKQVSTLVINPNTEVAISSSATQVQSGDSVDLTVTEENTGDTDLSNANVDVDNGVGNLSSPPDAGDDGDNVLEPGEVWSWTVLGVVVNSDTTFVATGHGTDPLGNDISAANGFSLEEDSVDVNVVNPTTVTTITASESEVSAGDSVTLTVTEQNDGDVDLTNPYVEVDNGVGTLSAPPDLGDDGDNVLEPGETWTWMVDVAVNATTTFLATGHGTDPFGNDVTYPDDPEEQDEVTVEVVFLGCTLTQGYWKTHSEKGPAAHPDDTWNSVGGPDAIFYLSGKSWLTVFKSPPKGNAYYNLAHQYMASVLNANSGAAVPADVQSAMDDAESLFNTYTPAQIAALKGNDATRKEFIELAGMLGSYNEGEIGPGHCD